MIMTHNATPPNKHGGIIESELLEMLETVINSRTGLSAIHHLLDETKSMSDIRARFNQWQTSQCPDKSKISIGSPNKQSNKAYKFVRR